MMERLYKIDQSNEQRQFDENLFAQLKKKIILNEKDLDGWEKLTAADVGEVNLRVSSRVQK